jgi:hypothetical protein
MRSAMDEARIAPAELARTIDLTPDSQAAPERLKKELGERLDPGGQTFERVMLLAAMEQYAAQIPSIPYPSHLQQTTLEAFSRLIDPPENLQPKLRLGHTWFVSACKIATLRRFPSGAYEFETSGIPRSWLLKIERRKLPELLRLLVFQCQGLRPFFAPHLAILTPKGGTLTEESVNRSHYWMARSLDRHPEVKGMIAPSWLHAPDVARHSPNLAWVPRFFLENGGFLADMGPADPHCGVLHKSTRRKQLHAEGKLNPRVGVGIWPRKAMLEWAAAHPEYEA